MFPGLRFRSPKNIVMEIKKQIDNGITKFRFMQSNLTAYKLFILKLCNEIKKERLDIKFWVDACVETTDVQSIKVLKEAGCIGIKFGLESLNINYLKYTKK